MSDIAIPMASEPNPQEVQKPPELKPDFGAAFLGPQFPKVKTISTTQAARNATAALQKAIEKTLKDGSNEFGKVDSDNFSVSVSVFSAHEDVPLFEFSHIGKNVTSSLDQEKSDTNTIYRIGSVSKLLVVYTLLVALGDEGLDDPITKYIPELKEDSAHGDEVHRCRWSDVTLRSLAGMVSGISRDYCAGDISAVEEKDAAWPPLDKSEIIVKGNSFAMGRPDYEPPTMEESMEMLRKRYPITSTFRAPFYSNSAFQLLEIAYEKATGEKFDDGFRRHIIEPLGLKRTSFFDVPGKQNALAIEPGYSFDMGPTRAAGSIYSSAADMATVGKSILASDLLSPSQTREWLKPLTHTGSLYMSVGMPWEIMRIEVPVSPTAPTSAVRHIDLYTKQGAIPPYSSILAVSPDHDIGFVVLATGRGLGAIVELVIHEYIPAVEAAAREAALQRFAGKYVSPGNETTHITLSLHDDRTGLVIDEFIRDGHDVMKAWAGMVGFKSAELWPMELEYEKEGLVSFQSLSQFGMPTRTESGKQRTITNYQGLAWAVVEDSSYGGFGVDGFIFRVGSDGRAVSVISPAFRTGEMTRVE